MHPLAESSYSWGKGIPKEKQAFPSRHWRGKQRENAQTQSEEWSPEPTSNDEILCSPKGCGYSLFDDVRLLA